jgi:histidinol dehydrogenase
MIPPVITRGIRPPKMDGCACPIRLNRAIAVAITTMLTTPARAARANGSALVSPPRTSKNPVMMTAKLVRIHAIRVRKIALVAGIAPDAVLKASNSSANTFHQQGHADCDGDDHHGNSQ